MASEEGPAEPRPPSQPAAPGSGERDDTVPAEERALADGWSVTADPPATAIVRPAGRIERYQLGDEIGKGGMGRVVEAVDSRLGRRVAIKEALPRGTDLRRRFEREVRITARLEHPSIVPLYDAGTTPAGNPFYVMRKVSGRPLERLIAEAQALGDRLTLLPHLLAATDALAHAHRRGVVHRDMKPANILVGEHGETVVIDWGLAKAIGEDDDEAEVDRSLAPSDQVETQIGAVFGTPGFMAPEQARGESQLDPRSDVYALGATLYHLLSGRPPHAGTSATEVIDRQLAEAPKPLPAVSPGVPVELVAIVDKALAYERDDRYPDASALADDLRRFLAGQLVKAHRYTPGQRLTRFLRKHRAVVGVATVATFALGAVGVYSVYNVVRERDRARHAEADALAAKQRAEEARDREADRADELLITQARAQVELNPTAAIAALKQLAPGSSRRRHARMVAMSAAAGGAAWGYPAHGRLTSSLELAPDGRRLLTAGADGTLRLFDLDRHEELLHLDFDAPFLRALWIADGAAILAGTSRGGLWSIDPTTGGRRAISTTLGVDMMHATAGGDRVAVVATDKTLWILEVATGALVRVPADGKVRDATFAPDGTWLAVDTDTDLRVLRPDGKQLVRVPGQASWMTPSRDARRLAFGLDGRAHELAIEGDRVTVTAIDPPGQRVDRHVLGLAYRGDRLYMSRIGGRLEVRYEGRLRPVMEQPQFPITVGVETRDAAMVYAGMGGRLHLVTPSGVRTMRAPTQTMVKQVAASPTSRYVAASTDGVTLVWDLDRLTPTVLSAARSQLIVFRDDDTLLQVGMSLPWQLIDVRSGVTTPITGAPLALVTGAEWHRDGRLLVTALGKGVFQIPRGGTEVERIGEGDVTVSTLLAGGRFAYGTEDGELVVGTSFDDRRSIITAPTPVVGLVEVGDGVAAVFGGGDLVRFDGGGRELARTRLPGAPTGALALDAAGRIIAGVDTRVVAWNGAAIEELATLDRPVRQLESSPTGTLALTTDNETFIVGPRPGPGRRVLARTQLPIALNENAAFLAAARPDQTIVVADVESNERAILPMPGHYQPIVSPSGRRVAYVFRDEIGVWHLDAPLDQDAWRAWLDSLTNARAGSTPEVVWPWQVP